MLKNDRLATLQPTLHPSEPTTLPISCLSKETDVGTIVVGTSQLRKNWRLEMLNSRHMIWEDINKVCFPFFPLSPSPTISCLPSTFEHVANAPYFLFGLQLVVCGKIISPK